MKKWTLFLLFLFYLFPPQGKSQGFTLENNQNKFSLSFQHVGSLIILPVSINGSQPLNFVLDTGSPYTVITNLNAINHFQLKKGKPIKISGLGKDLTNLEAYLSMDNSIQIGKSRSNTIDIVLLFEKGFDLSTRFGIPIYGIIGHDILKDFIVEINYMKRKIYFYKPDYFYANKNLSKFEELPIEIRNKKPYLKIHSEFNNQPVDLRLLIDTGSWESLWLFEREEQNIRVPEQAIDDYLGYGLNGEIHGKRARLDFVEIGTVRIDQPTTSFPDSLSVSNVSRKERNGTIGSEILQRFTTIYDFQNKKFYFKKNKKFKQPFHYNMAGLELYQPYPELPYLEVSYVRKDSPASKSGLKKGDAIRYINNKKIGIFSNKILDNSNYSSSSETIELGSKKRESISLPEILDLFKTKEGENIRIVFTRGDNQIERTTQFTLEKSI